MRHLLLNEYKEVLRNGDTMGFLLVVSPHCLLNKKYLDSLGSKQSNRIKFIVTDPNPRTESTVTKSGTELIVDMKVHNITAPYDILIVGYKNNKFVTMKRVPNDKKNSPYTLEGDMDEIKVMVWDGLSTLKPLCEAEEIPSCKWIIE